MLSGLFCIPYVTGVELFAAVIILAKMLTALSIMKIEI
jgi:hypothetical protein